MSSRIVAFTYPKSPRFKSVDTENISIADDLGIPIYSSDGDAPNSCFYYNSTDEIYKYKDSAGNVKVAGGGIFSSVVTKTANYTASDGDVVLADASGGAITITLPIPASNAWVEVKKIDSSLNAVTLSQNATETIDGQASIDLVNQYQSFIVVSDGTDWFVQRYEPNVDLATLKVWKTGRTWNIPAERHIQHILGPDEYIEGTDTVQGEGSIIGYEL